MPPGCLTMQADAKVHLDNPYDLAQNLYYNAGLSVRLAMSELLRRVLGVTRGLLTPVGLNSATGRGITARAVHHPKPEIAGRMVCR